MTDRPPPRQALASRLQTLTLREILADPDARRFARFVIVGVFNTAFAYGLYAALLFVGLHYMVALLLATLLSILFNFQTIGRLVFESAGRGRLAHFFGVYAVVTVVGLSGLRIGELLGIDPYVSGAVLTCPNALLSFLLNRRFVFRAPSQRPSMDREGA